MCFPLSRGMKKRKGNLGINLQKTVKLVFREGGLLQDSMKGYEFRQEQFMTALEIRVN